MKSRSSTLRTRASAKRPVSVLKEYIAGKRMMMTENDASIYYFYLTERHKYFKEMVEEIDSQYRTD